MANSWLSAQWQILGVSSHSIASYSYCPPDGRYPECSVGGNDHSSAQWQFLVGYLLAICGVLYCRTGGKGF